MQLTRRAVLGVIATASLEVPGAALAQSGPITGFNQNWSMLPALDTPGMIDNIRRLKPQMLRYPGGTVTVNKVDHVAPRSTLGLVPARIYKGVVLT